MCPRACPSHQPQHEHQETLKAAEELASTQVGVRGGCAVLCQCVVACCAVRWGWRGVSLRQLPSPRCVLHTVAASLSPPTPQAELAALRKRELEQLRASAAIAGVCACVRARRGYAASYHTVTPLLTSRPCCCCRRCCCHNRRWCWPRARLPAGPAGRGCAHLRRHGGWAERSCCGGWLCAPAACGGVAFALLRPDVWRCCTAPRTSHHTG